MKQFGYTKLLIATTLSLAVFSVGFAYIVSKEPVKLSIEAEEQIPTLVLDDLPLFEETVAPEEPVASPPLEEVEEVLEIVQETATLPEVREIPVVTNPLPEAPPQESFVPETLTAIDEKVRSAMVNILCIASPSSPASSISGSGVVISSSGLILTNAHVAQALLLKDYPEKDSVVCTIRKGSPATSAYTAELVYLSPQWIFENASALREDMPSGTGEHDFALLQINGATEFSSLPQTFSYLPISYKEQDTGNEVISAGYPASFLESEAIRRSLSLISVAGTIQDIFTFTRTTVDVLSLGGIALAQQGASGGAVVNPQGSLVGLIVTSSLETDTGARDMRAITTGHIARSFALQHGTSFASYIMGSISEKKKEFEETVSPILRETVLQVLTAP